jgi:FixJ family two-component response regulator
MTETDAMVFVVDDDAPMRESLKNLIRSVGLRAELFASAQEFLRSKRRDVPSCLVFDVRLPGLNGLDLQQELVSKDIQIQIIFLTGHGDIPMSVRVTKSRGRGVFDQAFPRQGSARCYSAGAGTGPQGSQSAGSG